MLNRAKMMGTIIPFCIAIFSSIAMVTLLTIFYHSYDCGWNIKLTAGLVNILVTCVYVWQFQFGSKSYIQCFKQGSNPSSREFYGANGKILWLTKSIPCLAVTLVLLLLLQLLIGLTVDRNHDILRLFRFEKGGLYFLSIPVLSHIIAFFIQRVKFKRFVKNEWNLH